MPTPDIYWDGKSRRTYGYWIYKLGAPLEDVPGNYIYAKETEPGKWRPLYAGQTSSLRDRLADHGKENCARMYGGTHIHVHRSDPSEKIRLAEEGDLIAEWHPICNG